MGSVQRLVAGVRESKYKLYVLFLFMLTFLINQFKTFALIATNASMAQEIGYGDRECDTRTDMADNLTRYLSEHHINGSARQYCLEREGLCSDDSEPTWCYWHYLGRGNDYQILAGPVYMILFSISGVPLGLISELHGINRKVCLVLCVIVWSLMTVLGGFSTRYWHLALTRLLMGVFSAGCVPFCASMIADYFHAEHRGAALGFFNWGVFVGYSLTFLLIVAERHLGWRSVYFISGLPGLIVALILALTVREPERRSEDQDGKKAVFQLSGMVGKVRAALRAFSDPVLLLLCVAGAVRNGAGLVWAYNILLFFNDYWPGTNLFSNGVKDPARL